MPVQTALLRIAQGAIANVLQHAHATRAEIALRLHRLDAGDLLLFTIADDGVGFDPALAVDPARRHSDSFGLQAARERIDQLGGEFTIDSRRHPAAGETTATREAVGTTLTVALTLERRG